MANRRGIAVGVLASVLFAWVPVTVKAISANPYTIGISRLTIAIIGLSIGILIDEARRRSLFRISRKELLALFFLGLFFGIHWLLYFVSIKQSSPSIAAVGVSTYGIQLSIFGCLFLGARFRLIDFAAVLIAIIGGILIVPEFSLGNQAATGFLIAVASGSFYAFLPIIHQKNRSLSTATRTWGQFFFALLFFVFFLPRADWQLSTTDWGGLVFLGIVCTLIAHTLWVHATTVLPPLTVSTVYYIYIPATMFSSWLIVGEPITIKKALGAALVIAANGVVVFSGLHDAKPDVEET